MFSAGCQSCALSCLSGVCYLGRSLLTGPGPALNIAAVVRMCFVPIYKGFNIFHCFPVCKNTFFNNKPVVFSCFFPLKPVCLCVFFIIFCLFFTPGHTYPIGFYATLCIRKSCPIKMALLKVIACVWPLPFSLVYRYIFRVWQWPHTNGLCPVFSTCSFSQVSVPPSSGWAAPLCKYCWGTPALFEYMP